MRRLGVLLIVLFTALSVRAEDWTTADGKTYKNVTVIAQEDDGVRIAYTGGVGKIPYYELSDDLLKRFGEDAASLAAKKAAAEKAQAAAALKAQQDAAELKKEQDEAAQAAAEQQTQSQQQQQNQTGHPSGTGQTPAKEQATAAGQVTAPGQTTTTEQATAAGQATAPGQANATEQATAAGQATAPGQANATEQATAAGQATTPGHLTPAGQAAAAAAKHAQPFAPNQPAGSQVHPNSTAAAPGAPGETEETNPYPNSIFQYNESSDISYLDSPVVVVSPISPDASPPAAPLQNATLFLRITTEGQKAEVPDQIEGVFNSPISLPKVSDRNVKFLVDGTFFPALPKPDSDDDATSPNPPNLNQVIFLLTPQQMRAILDAKNLNFSVGNSDYRIDENGIATFRDYLTDIDHLPPASTNLVRSYHRFLNRLPSIVSMISTTCEYIIFSAFGIVVVASIAAFVMGLTRFIKM